MKEIRKTFFKGIRYTGLLIILVLWLASFIGCGSSGGGAPLSGEFVDSAVSGLSYRTDALSGTTDANGTFAYFPGETVTFSLGGIVLGSTQGQATLTPVDLVPGATDTANSTVVNICRFLQTLDADGNLVNGIQITPAIIAAIEAYVAANPGLDLDFSNTAGFETEMTGPAGILSQLNAANVFAENSDGIDRGIRSSYQAWLHLEDSMDWYADGSIDYSVRPVVFVHGYSGSASQFESQAQRFLANGYPRTYLAAYDHDTGGAGPEDLAPVTNAALNEIIDGLLRMSGADKVDLIGHSRGTAVSFIYLSSPERAAKVAHYVNVDGFQAASLPGNVPTLALWGENNPASQIVGATNVYIPTQSHIQICTSAESFDEMYRFFNDEDPATNQILPEPGDHAWIAGEVNYFPANIGADGTLEIYEVDSDTGFRVADDPVSTWTIGEDGAWGPVRVNRNAAYEFAFEHAAGGNHYFYREAFTASNFFIRLNTSLPGGGIGVLLTQTPNHTNILISRDKEIWGDQGAGSDILMVDGNSVATPEVAARAFPGLSALFLLDWGFGGHAYLGNPYPAFFYGTHVLGQSDLSAPIPIFHSLAFMSGLDLYMPAASPPNRTIPVVLTPRGGGGATQTINVPNWPSSDIRISVVFRDFVQ